MIVKSFEATAFRIGLYRLSGAPARTAPVRRWGRGLDLLFRRRTFLKAPFRTFHEQKEAPLKRGQLVLPTKEPSGAVGHPFVELGFLP